MEGKEFNPRNFYLFSVTMCIDGLRKYKDVPVFSHKLIFPTRNDIYNIACQFFGVEPADDAQFQSFAVLGVYKFETEEDYLSYIGELQIG